MQERSHATINRTLATSPSQLSYTTQPERTAEWDMIIELDSSDPNTNPIGLTAYTRQEEATPNCAEL
jgi:hypothetical protein